MVHKVRRCGRSQDERKQKKTRGRSIKRHVAIQVSHSSKGEEVHSVRRQRKRKWQGPPDCMTPSQIRCFRP